MKMLVSDYDETLYTNNHSIRLNIKAIKKFRENGNIFVISTARDFKSIKEEVNKFKIPYDFLSCCNGNAIFDTNDKLIYSNYFDSENIPFFISLLSDKTQFMDMSFFNEFGYIDKDNIDLSRIIALKIISKKLTKFKDDINYLKENMKNITIENDYIIINVTPNKNKKDSIEVIKNLTNIDNNNIYTIGDNLNDLEMIKNYNGYNMLLSHPKLYKVSNGTCISVKQLIKKMSK